MRSSLGGLAILRTDLGALWLRTIHCEDDVCFRDADLTVTHWKQVGALTSLRFLHAGLFMLLPLDHLWVLQLPHSEAQVTEKAIAHFRSERAGCQISWVVFKEP